MNRINYLVSLRKFWQEFLSILSIFHQMTECSGRFLQVSSELSLYEILEMDVGRKISVAEEGYSSKREHRVHLYFCCWHSSCNGKGSPSLPRCLHNYFFNQAGFYQLFHSLNIVSQCQPDFTVNCILIYPISPLFPHRLTHVVNLKFHATVKLFCA